MFLRIVIFLAEVICSEKNLDYVLINDEIYNNFDATKIMKKKKLKNRDYIVIKLLKLKLIYNKTITNIIDIFARHYVLDELIDTFGSKVHFNI